jgi:hypothetical protein
MKRPNLADDAQFRAWARHATAGIDASGVMIGMLSADTTGARWEFAIQISHCLLEDKPLLLVAPHGARIPARLLAAASAVEYYVLNDQASMEAAEPWRRSGSPYGTDQFFTPA